MTYDIMNPGKTHVTRELEPVYDEITSAGFDVDVYPEYIIIDCGSQADDIQLFRFGENEEPHPRAQFWSNVKDWNSFMWNALYDDIVDIAGVLYRYHDCGVFGVCLGEY